MAWQDVETDVGSKVGRCAYSVHLKHGGARITVPQNVAVELRWTAKSTFKLQVGSGEVERSLRLVASSTGKITAKAPPKGKGLIIRLGRWPALAPRDVDKVFVEHEVQPEASALVIRLPLHATLNEPAPAKPTPPASIMSGPAPAMPARRSVDVSDKFFNDPKRPVAMASGTRK